LTFRFTWSLQVPHDSLLVSGIYAVLRERLMVIVGSADVDLFETGLVDSIGLVELILALEDRFGINLPMENLEIDDLRTVRKIADLVVRFSVVPDGRVVEGL
jgi:D-alanine--poly(phosphoribitol) ligase subunit 2